MTEIFRLGTELKSNTCYCADRDLYDVYYEHTKTVDKKIYGDGNVRVFCLLENKKNITIDFGGATLVLHGKIQPFIIRNCENIKIKNCVIEYDRPSFSEGVIEELGEDYIKVYIDKSKYPYYVKDGKMIVTSEFWENDALNEYEMFMMSYDTETREGTGGVVSIIGKDVVYPKESYVPPIKYVPYQDGESLILKGEIPEWWRETLGEGMILVKVHEKRVISYAYLESSQDIFLENLRVINGFGLGVFVYHTKNIYIDRLILTYDEKSKGVITNGADVLHTIGAYGDLVVENCIFEGMIDDAINIHSHFFGVKEYKNNILVAKRTAHNTDWAKEIEAGDEIAIYKGYTMELAAKYRVLSSKITDEKDLILELDRPLGYHNQGDLIENLTTQANVTIKNSVFGKSNSHLRFQSRGKIMVENCKIGLPVLLTGDTSYWFESSPVNDLTFINCEFCTQKAQIRLIPEVMPTEKEPYYHKNIRFLNNTFVSENPITGGYADNIEFYGNVNKNGKEMVLTLTNCGKVLSDNCRVERKTEVKTELKRN